MASHASTLLLLAVVVGLASLASYLLSQWRARQGRDTLALAGIGLGTALLLAAVFLVVLGALLLSHEWLARLDETSSQADTAARDARAMANPFAVPAVDASPDRESEADARRDTSGIRPPADVAAAHAASVAETPVVVSHDRAVRATERRRSAAAITTNDDPWAATRCVVPFKREWNDGTRWTIVNDCGVAVAILIATCERAAEECPSGAWRYAMDGVVLPAKLVRPTTEVEEMHRATELRHAACVVTDAAAVNLIGTDPQDRTEQWLGEIEQARARDACLSEVRRLARLGARSGVPIESLIGTAPYSRVEQ